MGRRVNIPQPLVLSTELSALTLSFHVGGDDVLEQWLYADTNEYLPDRSLYPLTLTPAARGYDADTLVTHNLSFSRVRWYEVTSTGDTEIINTYDTSEAQYVISGFTLVVKKNVVPSEPVTIRCEATYIDPRDNATLGMLEESVTLRTSRDATATFPIVVIDAPKQQTWNPLGEGSPVFTFTARVTKKDEDITADSDIVWYGVDVIDGVASRETLIENMPSYVSGQGTDTLVVDARYSEQLTIIARAREDALSPFYGSADYRTLSWKIPTLSATTYSAQGSSVRASTGKMTFDTIVNVPGSVLSEAVKRENLAMLWKRRTPMASTQAERAEVSIGWGQRVTLEGADLIQENGGTVAVYPHIYLIGAQRIVTYDGEEVTYNDAVVTERETD